MPCQLLASLGHDAVQFSLLFLRKPHWFVLRQEPLRLRLRTLDDAISSCPIPLFPGPSLSQAW